MYNKKRKAVRVANVISKKRALGYAFTTSIPRAIPANAIMPKQKYNSEEVKFADLILQASQTTVNQEPVLINGIAQGDDYNERVGRKINLKSCNFRFTQTALAVNTNAQFR